MILNDNPNCQVSRILMNPRPILSDSSENHPTLNTFKIALILSSAQSTRISF
jgi:hypothetical protein